MTSYSRRAFLRHTLTASAAALILPAGGSLVCSVRGGQSSLRSIQLGGPSFASTDDPEALALAHRKLGYRAAYCPNVATKETNDPVRTPTPSPNTTWSSRRLVVGATSWMRTLRPDGRIWRPSPMAWHWRRLLELAVALTSPDRETPLFGTDPTRTISLAIISMPPSRTPAKSSMRLNPGARVSLTR